MRHINACKKNLIVLGGVAALAWELTGRSLADDVPVAPIDAVVWEGWTNSIVLKHDLLEVVIVPEIGRIASVYAPGEENILRFRKSEQKAGWNDHGGSWFFPVAQSDWKHLQEKAWPPPAELAPKPWKARAWKSADGSLNCVLDVSYGAPLHVDCRRTFKLRAGQSAVHVRQRLTRVEASEIPVLMWNVSQVGAAEKVVLPIARKTEFANGIHPVFGDLPPERALRFCPGLLVCTVSELGEVKLGTDARNQWIAATAGSRMLVQQVLTLQGSKGYPDDGCTIETYNHPGFGYTDLELLSPVVNLPVGETIENELRISLHHFDPGQSDCDLAATARGLLSIVAPVAEDSPPAP